MSRTEVHPFDVVLRVSSLLLSSSGEGVGTLERYIGRICRAFQTPVHLIVLPDQLMLTEASRSAAPRTAVVKATLRSKPPTRSEIDNLGVVVACLNPPEQAIVLCVAEKSQSQALD